MHAADDGEQPNRRAECERVEPDDERRGTETEQEPRLRNLLRPGADVRQQAGEAEGAAPLRAEQTQRVAKGQRVHSEPLRIYCQPKRRM